MALTLGQAKCVDTLDRSIVVAAGAGSGKTFTLTKRVVHAITSGQVDDIERVCAITFTNKAANELKSRIKAELRASGMLEQALKVDEAWISTIHGLCARILRAHAIQLGLDPCFSMIDPALSDQLREQAVDQALQDAQAIERSDGRRSAIDALFAEYPARSNGLRGDSVQSMVHSLMAAASSNERSFDAFELMQPAVNPAALVSAVLDAFMDLADAADVQNPNKAREEWAANVRQWCIQMRADLESGNAANALWALQTLDSLPKPKKVGTADYREHVAQTLDVYQTNVMELRLSLAESHLQTLVALARRAYELYCEAKCTQGVLDNDDLLVLAGAAIRDYPDIEALYADKFQLVMVDEFQDTDQMQLNMIKRLAGPDAQRLCTVGDAQQSIYRFRGADVQVYRRHLQDVSSVNPDNVIVLPDNFRSHPDVLALVDSVFGRPGMFDSFMSLKPGRDEARVRHPLAQDVPRVQVQLTSSSYGGAKTEQLRRKAADRLADAFADLRRRGHTAGQMAVLLGGMTYANVYADALRARGFACVITGGSVFSQSPEVLAVLDLVQVASNPYRTQALHNVLSGPLFQLCADDLLRLTTVVDKPGDAPRRCNLCSGLKAYVAQQRSDAPQTDWSEQLTLAVRVMGQFMEDVGRISVADLLHRAIVDSGWLTRLEVAGAEGLATAGNVYKALRVIESIEETQAAGPARVARQLQALLDQSKEAPGALSATGGDFVRIMTVHSSKGLEFPIVAVAEFKEPCGDSSRLLSVDLDGTVYLSLDLGNTVKNLQGPAGFSGPTDLYASIVQDCNDESELECAIRSADGLLALRAALFEHEYVGDVEESKRLLYVALTRAEEALVVSMVAQSTKSNPCATPKSSLGFVVTALADQQGGFAPGVSHVDFGGTLPALVEHVVMTDEEDPSTCETLPIDEKSLEPCPEAEVDLFAVPAPPSLPVVNRTPYAPAHEGIFSYSSVAEASHEGDLLDDLARRFHLLSDIAETPQAQTLFLQPFEDDEDDFDYVFSWQDADLSPTLDDADDDSWAYMGTSSADSDKATDLGTAFHRLAQYAVETRSGKALSKPDESRIKALSRSCNLDVDQRDRLDQALNRWFASDVCARMTEFADLRAEVPFFVSVPLVAQNELPAFLEGEIDLLAFSPDKSQAVVVDYKTGGRDDETADELGCKHVLQASCYAYAIMLQGTSEVEAYFVRVERPRGDDPAQPQCVHYRFTSADLPVLAQAIAQAYALAHE